MLLLINVNKALTCHWSVRVKEEQSQHAVEHFRFAFCSKMLWFLQGKETMFSDMQNKPHILLLENKVEELKDRVFSI